MRHLGYAIEGLWPRGARHAGRLAGHGGAIHGDRRDPYDVLLVVHDGDTLVFASYR